MHPRKVSLFLLLTAFLMFACQWTDVAPVSTQASPTRPSATPTPNPFVYRNEEYGLSVTYPAGWKTETDEEALSWFISPDEKVMAVLYAFSLEADDTPETVAKDLFSGVSGELHEISILQDEAMQTPAGDAGWRTVFTARRNSDRLLLKVSITTVLHGANGFMFLVFGEPDAYEQYAREIQSLTTSLVFTEALTLDSIPRRESLVLLGSESTNPREYDPATTHGSGDKRVFSGLVSFDPHLNLVPDLAERWEVSEDGTVYTFYLRENARFHDGRPVTAQDVVYSWERAARPETESDTVLTYLGDIVGVQDVKEGKAEHIAGLEVIDDHTLRVTIDAPKPYFLLKLTYPTAFVVDRANVESGPDWYRHPNGTGPYKLVEWKRFERMVYERNEDFYLGPPAIRYIIVQLYSGVGIRLYETGEIDITSVYSYFVPRVTDPDDPLHADLITGVDLCTGYVVFDVSQPPFDDVNVRRAFTMAFDRKKYLDVALRGVGLPAKGLYPPGLPGYNPDLEGLPYDPARARELLAESKYGGPAGLPPIVFTNGGIGTDVDASVAALAEMWEQNLGVTITIENLEPDRYYDEIYAGNHGQLFQAGWCADYPDPENFADVLFHTGSPQNNGNYSNPELDALLEQARTERDVNARIALYQQAEQMIVNDAPVLFTVHYLSHVLVKPYVKGYVWTPIDIPIERYLWLEWDTP